MSNSKPRPSSSKSKNSAKKEMPVELGFLADEDPSSKWKLKSGYFPMKFGGLPAWLDLKNIPTGKEIKCSSCDGPMKFLLQIYAPLDNNPEAFHRMIYVFVCSNKKCCVERNSNKNLLAVSGQLARVNEFYSSAPPEGSKPDPELLSLNPKKFGVSLCQICGIKATQKCSGCKKAAYCGRDHQTLDWKNGHKEECKNPDFVVEEPKEKFCFPELEIVFATEEIPKQSTKERSEKDRIDDYQKLIAEGKTGTLDDSVSTKEALEAASYRSDKAFNKFKKRIAYDPTQILRYDRKGEPLWVAAEKKLEKTQVPPCQYCKGPRVFEFQIMPQLLNDVGQDAVDGDLDWGTLAVYTCENSCNSVPYKIEYIWQQDFKGDDNDDD